MSKKEDFKSFVSRHPDLITVVRNKSHTWQDLFEVYDLYGEDETSWDKYLKINTETKSSGSSVEGLAELSKLFKNVNIDNIQKYIDTAQKAIGIVQGLTGAGASGSVVKGPESPRPLNKIFED